ncbi:MAG: hypothetical protein AAF940_08760 [Pseudomonadota bacterium]
MFAVLTGDIVASSSLAQGDLDLTLEAIEVASNEIGSWPQVTNFGFARRAGDSWQIAFDAPHYSLRGALYVKACIRRLHKERASRIALAVGEGSMNAADPNSAHGDAFTSSGRLLGTMPTTLMLDHASGGAMAAAAILADTISDGWTVAQARALCEQLPPNAGIIEEAAKKLAITRQAVGQALQGGGFHHIEAALSRLEVT